MEDVPGLNVGRERLDVEEIVADLNEVWFVEDKSRPIKLQQIQKPIKIESWVVCCLPAQWNEVAWCKT